MYQLLFHNRKSAVAGIIMLAITVSPAFAQFRTSIQGVVTDPTGAVIPGATLTLKNLSTNETITRTSDADGVYNFNALPADPFVLTAEKDGFQKKVLDHLQLIPEQPNGINVQLEPGGASTTVTVNGDTTPAIDTQTANTSRTISANEVQHIPVYERDRPASSGWCLESRPMERSRAAAVDFRLREPKPEPHPEAAATWGIRAVSLLRKMALRQTPTAASSMRTDIASTASARRVPSGVERRSLLQAKTLSATSRSSRMLTTLKMAASRAR